MRKSGWLMVAAVAFLATMPVAGAQAQAQAAPQAQTPAKPKPSGTAAPAHKATAPASPYDHTLLRPALLTAKAPDTYQVKFTTTRGDFVVTVTRAWAPIGADRFYNLVKHHYYDNASFFRVVPAFVVQFGISAYPPVSAAWKNADLKDDPVTQSNKRGYLTFATAGANTRTTQVFISLKDNAALDRQGFAPFGVVDGKGMNVVEMFYDQYGDTSGPDQSQIELKGKPYLDKGWPKLDSIKTATLVAPAGTASAANPGAAPKTAPAAKKP